MTNARTFRTARSVAGDIVSHFEGEGSERRLVMTAPSGSTHSIAAIVGDNRTDFDLHFQRFAKYHGGFAQRFDENDRLVNGDPCIENDGSFVFVECEFAAFRNRLLRVVDLYAHSARRGAYKLATVSKRSGVESAKQFIFLQPHELRFASADELRAFNVPSDSCRKVRPMRPLHPLD